MSSSKKSKNRRRKIFRKELPVTWSKGGHKGLKREIINKRELKQGYE
jgi:hypothetical protein